jgi:hypothetical protein
VDAGQHSGGLGEDRLVDRRQLAQSHQVVRRSAGRFLVDLLCQAEALDGIGGVR